MEPNRQPSVQGGSPSRIFHLMLVTTFAVTAIGAVPQVFAGSRWAWVQLVLCLAGVSAAALMYRRQRRAPGRS